MHTKGHCYPKSIILQAVYFKLSFTLSYRDAQEIMRMRVVSVDHGTIQRRECKFTPLLEPEIKMRKVKVRASWERRA